MADAVTAQIDHLPALDDLTLADKGAVEEARIAYNSHS